jgi:hypothetical protein
MDWTAVGTLMLAGVTLLLVVATFRLASQAAEDTRAQWRPVLLVQSSTLIMLARYPGIEVPENDPNVRVTVTVENVGRGPALDVGAVVLSPADDDPADNVSAVAPNATASVSFDLITLPDVLSVQFSYTDISRVGHGTAAYLGTPHDARELPVLYQAVSSHPRISAWRKALGSRRHKPDGA